MKVSNLRAGKATWLQPGSGYFLLNGAEAGWAVGALALETVEARSAAAASRLITLWWLSARSVTVAGCITQHTPLSTQHKAVKHTYVRSVWTFSHVCMRRSPGHGRIPAGKFHSSAPWYCSGIVNTLRCDDHSFPPHWYQCGHYSCRACRLQLGGHRKNLPRRHHSWDLRADTHRNERPFSRWSRQTKVLLRSWRFIYVFRYLFYIILYYIF